MPTQSLEAHAALHVMSERAAMSAAIATAHHLRAMPSYQTFMQTGTKA